MNFGYYDIDDQSAGNYLYDSIGELSKDVAEGIDTILWTLYGKVHEIHKINGDTVRFAYDATGNRIMKEYWNDSLGVRKQTFYTRDAQGNIMAIYDYKEDTLTLAELPMYGSSQIGVIKPNLQLYPALPVDSNDEFTLGVNYNSTNRKLYFLTNHLGNVMTTISDRRLPVYTSGVLNHYEPEIVSAVDNYSFGMEVPERSYNSFKSKWGFNGQLKDDEISNISGAYTTALFWEYDTRLGRRWNTDPVIKSWQSAYACFSNSPIWKIDPNGDDDFFNADGSFSHRTKTGNSIVVINSKRTEMPFSEFSASRSNADIKASANIVGYYKSAAGIAPNIAVGVSPNTKGLAYSNKQGIWVSTKGGANPLLDDSKNLINTLNHEKYHKDNDDPESIRKGEFTFSDHLSRYDSQMSDATFKETTNAFKAGMANNYASYLLGGINEGEISEEKADKIINDFNAKYKSYGISITGKNNFGTIELKSKGLTNEGKSTGWQQVNPKKDAH